MGEENQQPPDFFGGNQQEADEVGANSENCLSRREGGLQWNNGVIFKKLTRCLERRKGFRSTPFRTWKSRLCPRNKCAHLYVRHGPKVSAAAVKEMVDGFLFLLCCGHWEEGDKNERPKWRINVGFVNTFNPLMSGSQTCSLARLLIVTSWFVK